MPGPSCLPTGSRSTEPGPARQDSGTGPAAAYPSRAPTPGLIAVGASGLNLLRVRTAAAIANGNPGVPVTPSSNNSSLRARAPHSCVAPAVGLATLFNISSFLPSSSRGMAEPSWRYRRTGRDNAHTRPCQTAVLRKHGRQTQRPYQTSVPQKDHVETRPYATSPQQRVPIRGITHLNSGTDSPRSRSSARPWRNSIAGSVTDLPFLPLVLLRRQGLLGTSRRPRFRRLSKTLLDLPVTVDQTCVTSEDIPLLQQEITEIPTL